MFIKNINEINRLGGLERQRGNWAWPFAYAYALLGLFQLFHQSKTSQNSGNDE